MRLLIKLIAASSIAGSAFAQAPSPSAADMKAVSPALGKYASSVIDGDLWKRPGLTPRERSIVTLAVMVARNQQVELPFYLNRALDNGVAPKEIKSSDIYWGALPWIGLQAIMVAIVIAFPITVTALLDTPRNVDLDKVRIEVPEIELPPLDFGIQKQ